MSRRSSLALAFASLLGSAALPGPVHAQTCEQELARQDAALRQLETDARREGAQFVLDDARRHALGEVSKGLKGDPTADAAMKIKADWDRHQSFVNQLQSDISFLGEMSRCLNGGQPGCFNRLLERARDETRRWLESLGNEGISRALERVERTRSIMENFTKRAAGTATDAATRGIDSCLRDFDRRVQQAQNNAAPVAPRQPSPAGASAPPKRGMSGGTIAAIGAGAAGATAAVLFGLNAIDEANNLAGSGGGSSSSDSSQIRLVNNPVTIRCAAISGSTQSLCTADIVLDVANVFSAGTQVCIRTDPTGAFFDCRVKGSSNQIAFRIEIRTACQATLQTGIFVYRDSPTGVTPTARVSATIPVTCN